MFGNIGGLIATWSFFSWDAPNYHIGNGLNLATGSAILITATLTLFWMKRDNQKRENRSLEEELAGATLRKRPRIWTGNIPASDGGRRGRLGSPSALACACVRVYCYSCLVYVMQHEVS